MSEMKKCHRMPLKETEQMYYNESTKGKGDLGMAKSRNQERMEIQPKNLTEEEKLREKIRDILNMICGTDKLSRIYNHTLYIYIHRM